MEKTLPALIATAAFLGFLHTITGPDHYLPFIMISWARKWSQAKTLLITFICGIGHILSSVVLGFIGIAAGLALNKLELFESNRGEIAAWLLISFGLAYTIWGIRQAVKNKPHTHQHIHINGGHHEHEHTHTDSHAHTHLEDKKANITPWALFIIFVFGPCEVLIPLFIYPAAEKSLSGAFAVTMVFALTTIATMLIVVALASKGINFLPMKKAQRFTHAIAGTTILMCGMAMVFLGL